LFLLSSWSLVITCVFMLFALPRERGLTGCVDTLQTLDFSGD
jgi:hypothetical protein